MVLLASNSKSRFLKAADLDGEKKFRIKERDRRGGWDEKDKRQS